MDKYYLIAIILGIFLLIFAFKDDIMSLAGYSNSPDKTITVKVSRKRKGKDKEKSKSKSASCNKSKSKKKNDTEDVSTISDKKSVNSDDSVSLGSKTFASLMSIKKTESKSHGSDLSGISDGSKLSIKSSMDDQSHSSRSKFTDLDTQ